MGRTSRSGSKTLRVVRRIREIPSNHIINKPIAIIVYAIVIASRVWCRLKLTIRIGVFRFVDPEIWCNVWMPPIRSAVHIRHDHAVALNNSPRVGDMHLRKIRSLTQSEERIIGHIEKRMGVLWYGVFHFLEFFEPKRRRARVIQGAYRHRVHAIQPGIFKRRIHLGTTGR